MILYRCGKEIFCYTYLFIITKGGFTMIKIHIGLKGSGKTKKIIDDVNKAVSAEKGNVVCITEGDRLIHDIDRSVRLVNTEQFDIKNFDMFTGMLCGIIAQDFERLEKKFDVSFTLMISADTSEATELTKKYMD